MLQKVSTKFQKVLSQYWLRLPWDMNPIARIVAEIAPRGCMLCSVPGAPESGQIIQESAKVVKTASPKEEKGNAEDYYKNLF